LVYVEGQNFEGYVLNKIESGGSRSNQFIKSNQHFCFVNRRPIDPISQLLNLFDEIYKKNNHSTKYAFILNLKIEQNQIDVNLSPNKREVLIRKPLL